MKKVISLLLLVTLLLTLASCGDSLPKEKRAAVDKVVSELESAVFSVGKQLDELVSYNGMYDSYDADYEYFDEKYMSLVGIKRELKATYDEKAKTFTEEDADAFVSEHLEPIATAEALATELRNYLDNIKKEMSK